VEFLKYTTLNCITRASAGVLDAMKTREDMARTILLVEDSAPIRHNVSVALRSAGYAVIPAVNGRHALEELDGRRIDMVITDITMPEMDGIEFIKRLRAMAGYGDTPVVLLTTEPLEFRRQEAMSAGVSSWIFKPFTLKHLLESVRGFIG
jgi:two-component system chemotaxis response regulator CheY